VFCISFFFAIFHILYQIIKITERITRANTFERKNVNGDFFNRKPIFKCTWYFSEETFYVSNSIQNVSNFCLFFFLIIITYKYFKFKREQQTEWAFHLFLVWLAIQIFQAKKLLKDGKNV